MVAVLDDATKEGGNGVQVVEDNVDVTVVEQVSEGRASGWIMSGLPVLFMVVMSVVDPDWMAPLYNDVIGNVILAVVIGLTVAGALLMRKVSTIDA